MSHSLEDFRPEGSLHDPDISSVITAAHVVKQQITAIGGNDSEFNIIDTIIKKARSGTLEYVEAILQIEAVLENKHGNGGYGLQG